LILRKIADQCDAARGGRPEGRWTVELDWSEYAET